MSSSRSVAAARARRAGGNDASRILKPSQTRNTNQKIPMNAPPAAQPMTQPVEEVSPYEQKLSVSDAFALVTIRLGRVESVLQKLDVNEIASNLSSGQDKGNGGANNVLVKTISSRIDDLENVVNDKISIKEHEDIVLGLKGTISSLKEEILDLKNTAFKLQNMMIDVNQKLLSSFVKEELHKQAPSETNSHIGSDVGEMESVTLESDSDIQGSSNEEQHADEQQIEESGKNDEEIEEEVQNDEQTEEQVEVEQGSESVEDGEA